MSIPNLLHEMCADLADADLNAIRKARGFSLSETASRTSFSANRQHIADPKKCESTDS